jgi:hypothetical protein
MPTYVLRTVHLATIATTPFAHLVNGNCTRHRGCFCVLALDSLDTHFNSISVQICPSVWLIIYELETLNDLEPRTLPYSHTVVEASSPMVVYLFHLNEPKADTMRPENATQQQLANTSDNECMVSAIHPLSA